MDGPQHICDMEWVDVDGHGGSESFFSAAKEDDGQANSSSPLAQKGVVADVEGKKSGRSRSRSSSGGIVQIREKKAKSDPTPADALKKMREDEKLKQHVRFFAVLGDKLHCNLCGISFGTRSNVRRDHIGSAKHVRLLGGEGEKKQHTIASLFESGMKAAEKFQLMKVTDAHRLRVMDALMESNIKIGQLGPKMIELLEENRDFRLSLGDVTHLARATLPVLTAMADKGDIAAVHDGGNLGSFQFDGYSRKDEFAGIVLRTTTKDFVIEERAVACKMFKRGLTGQEWYQVVDRERRKLGDLKLVFTIADGHPSNGIVGNLLQETTPGLFHSFCLCHTLVKVGTNFHRPDLESFLQLWGAVFKNSLAAREVFREKTGESWKRKHKVRWWTTMGVMEQVMRLWNVVPALVAELEVKKISVESVRKLKAFLDHQQGYAPDFLVELLAAYDGGNLFFQATTFLEGTSFLSPFVSQQLSLLKQIVHRIEHSGANPVSTLPHVLSLISQAPPVVNRGLIWANAKKVVMPGFLYFKRHFVEMTEDTKARQFRDALELYDFAALFNPVYCQKIVSKNGFSLQGKLRGERTRNVLVAALGATIVTDLERDFGAFVETVERNISPEVKYRPPQVLEWWRTHGSKTGAWAAAARLFTLLQPSEASVERLFSMMRNAVDDSQESMLEDQVELRIRTKFRMKIN
jgi:hypothetical protein